MGKVKSDIEIARAAKMKPIQEILDGINVPDKAEVYSPIGRYIAKIKPEYLETLKNKKDGKLILVTAITPTPAGEGKTTTSVGLCDGLNKIGKKSVVCLREPSLGPSFGMKGGAAGGGYAQVVPMEQINLHFTGDFHAITSAHNLLAALIDNHIYWGNKLNIDVRRVVWKRVMDMNDRSLRSININLGGVANGYPREDGFDITVASEIMAIFCLSNDLKDLENRIGNITIGYTRDKKPIYAKDLNANGPMTVLLKDAIRPNVTQTLENNPAIIHGGPFANIAHGCNSVIATKTGLKLSDYVVTEAGFGADLGAEKFLDIKCRKSGLKPDCVVIVATIRALKMHGGVKKDDLKKENVDIIQNCEVTGFDVSNGKILGIRTSKGNIKAKKIGLCVAGSTNVLAEKLNMTLPIETHLLQACVSEPIKPILDNVVTFGAGHFYCSQSDKGEMVMGGDLDGYNSYAQRGNLPTLQHVLTEGIAMFPFLSKLKMLRTWGGIMDMSMDGSPIIDKTHIEGLYLNCGWCYGGFKATPASGWTFAHTIAQDRPHELNSGYSLNRFSTGHLIDEKGLGTKTWIS